MSITIDDGEGGTTAESLLDALEEASIVSVKKLPDGNFEIMECCDRYYGAILTPGQIRMLANELARLVEHPATIEKLIRAEAPKLPK